MKKIHTVEGEKVAKTDTIFLRYTRDKFISSFATDLREV